MKYYLALLFLGLCATVNAQGARSMIPHRSKPSLIINKNAEETQLLIEKFDSTKSRVADTPAYSPLRLATFGLNGLGNTNTESFSNVSSSGKLSGYIRPYKGDVGYLQVDFSFDVNASNTDSLLTNTLLFPDQGSTSFYGTATYNQLLWHNGANNSYWISPFFEFSDKNIKGTKADSSRSFNTLNATLGVGLQYLYTQGNDNVSFTLTPYLSLVHVPDPGTKDYRYLFTKDENSKLTTSVHSWGIKATFQYNSFQIFADFRNVTGSDSDYPVTGLKGFHPNIGIIFNAEIFEK